MTFTEALILIAAGLFAGCINTLAGGGSLITMPLLIFMGLPSVEANASNRVALFIQNIFAIQGFRSKGVFLFPFSLWLGISATFGALIGANIAVDIKGNTFNKILAIVMILVMVLTLVKPYLSRDRIEEYFGKKQTLLSILIFFGIGIYGGFIQAGVGFLIIAALTNIHGLNMAKTNSVKVTVILIYTVSALVVFQLEGAIRWQYGLILALGNAIGGWITSRWSVGKNDKWVRAVLVVTVSALAIKLWFF